MLEIPAKVGKELDRAIADAITSMPSRLEDANERAIEAASYAYARWHLRRIPHLAHVIDWEMIAEESETVTREILGILRRAETREKNSLKARHWTSSAGRLFAIQVAIRAEKRTLARIIETQFSEAAE